MTVTKLYRYVTSTTTIDRMSTIDVVLKEFTVVKSTRCGYWFYDGFKRRFVLKSGKKRFAYPNKESALVNFLKRKKKRIEYLENDLISEKVALRIALYMQAENKTLIQKASMHNGILSTAMYRGHHVINHIG